MKILIFLLSFLLLANLTKLNSQWQQFSSGMYDMRVYSLAATQTHIFAGTPQSLSVTTNNGSSWFLNMFNAQLEPVNSLVTNGTFVACGVQGYGVTVSANNGNGWTFHHPLGGRTIYSLCIAGGFVFAGASADTDPAGVYISSDNGYSFNPTSLLDKTVYSLAVNGSMIFAGTSSEGIYITSNNGINWTQSVLNNQAVLSLCTNGNFVYAGTQSNGVFISTNNGTSWSQSSLNNQSVKTLTSSGSSIFAGTLSPNSFYVSNNNGTNWIIRNEGLASDQVNALYIKNNFIFAGTSSNGVYRRPLSDILAIQPVSSVIPDAFSISQNYPNPFNPSTKIKFSVPVSGFVELKVYDMLGKELSKIVEEHLSPGIYEVEWDASNYPSGVYYYRIRSGDFRETMKMILVK